MRWNWQHKDWPNFQWDMEALVDLESKFQRNSGVLIGVQRHFDQSDRQQLAIELITTEAIKTSEIEGEYLDRDSVQSSILNHFGLHQHHRKIAPAEKGIADLMINLLESHNLSLSHDLLYQWHKMLINGHRDITDIGRYRTHEAPMRVVSGRLDTPTIHFEAPPSSQVKEEMNEFLNWWQKTSPSGTQPLPPLTRAGVAHLHFVCIHPFEDGNGRIGRALALKSISEHLEQSTWIALSQTIENKRKVYYDMLERNNKRINITDWLVYFAQVILSAQDYTNRLTDFILEKTKLYDQLSAEINVRQRKVLKRIFREGLEGFKGGLSAENYIRITQTSRATATRDLQDLILKKALIKTGELKGTRYYLNIKSHSHLWS